MQISGLQLGLEITGAFFFLDDINGAQLQIKPRRPGKGKGTTPTPDCGKFSSTDTCVPEVTQGHFPLL